MRDVVDELCAFERRGACTDAERRAALWVHDDLRSRGYDPWVETVWVRPQWGWAIVWHAALGVAVSLVSTTVPIVAAGAVLLALSWATGLLRRLFYRRATEIVVVDPPADGLALWLVAHTDAPRCGVGFRERWRRWMRRVDASWLLLGLLLAVAVLGGLRGLGIEDGWLGFVQMVPTVGLLLFVGVALDSVLTDFSPGASDAGRRRGRPGAARGADPPAARGRLRRSRGRRRRRGVVTRLRPLAQVGEALGCRHRDRRARAVRLGHGRLVGASPAARRRVR